MHISRRPQPRQADCRRWCIYVEPEVSIENRYGQGQMAEMEFVLEHIVRCIKDGWRETCDHQHVQSRMNPVNVTALKDVPNQTSCCCCCCVRFNPFSCKRLGNIHRGRVCGVHRGTVNPFVPLSRWSALYARRVHACVRVTCRCAANLPRRVVAVCGAKGSEMF